MELKTFVFYLLLCQYLVQRTTSKIAESEEEWSANGCCHNCPNLNDIVRNSGNQRYVPICQHGKSGTNSYFATLFDKENKIPVFSKYTLSTMDTNSNEQNTNEQSNRNFLFEVQLVGHTTFGNIGNFRDVQQKLGLQREETWQRIKNTLAIEEDYKSDKNYHQGHLRPYAGCQNREAELATNTFTNVVPQVGSFNQGAWKSIEFQTRILIKDSKCEDNIVVTGAVPSSDELNGSVNIPSFMWSYVLCTNRITVFLVPNIENKLIHMYNFVTSFSTTKNNLPEVLHAIRDLEGRVRNIQILSSKGVINKASKDQAITLVDIRITIDDFVKKMWSLSEEPTWQGRDLYLQLICKGATKVKRCAPAPATPRKNRKNKKKPKTECETHTRIGGENIKNQGESKPQPLGTLKSQKRSNC